MSVFLEIAEQYTIAASAFADAESTAFQANDDAAYDRAIRAQRHNDQAYFLYLFSRYEPAINRAVEALLAGRANPDLPWADRRIWQAWARGHVRDIPLLSKMEILTDKGRQDYATAKRYYEGRNTIAHGAVWEVPFLVPEVAEAMHDLVGRFVSA